MQSQRFYRNCEPWLLDLDQYKQSQIFALVGLLLWKGVSWWSSALCSRGVLRHGWSELKWPAVWPKLWPIRVRCCIQVVELSFTSVYFLASQRGLLKYWLPFVSVQFGWEVECAFGLHCFALTTVIAKYFFLFFFFFSSMALKNQTESLYWSDEQDSHV